MWCAKKGDLARVQWLLERGARVNVGAAADGYTALMNAADKGHLEVVRELLVRGANVNTASTSDGGTALIDASFCGHLDYQIHQA